MQKRATDGHARPWLSGVLDNSMAFVKHMFSCMWPVLYLRLLSGQFLMFIRIIFIAVQPGVFSGIRLILALQNLNYYYRCYFL